MYGDARSDRRLLRHPGEAFADRVRHRNMRDHAFAEKAFLAGEGAIDELVDHDKVARLIVFAQGADS